MHGKKSLVIDDNSDSLNKSCKRPPKESMGSLELSCRPPTSNNPLFKLVPTFPKSLSGRKSHEYGSTSAGSVWTKKNYIN